MATAVERSLDAMRVLDVYSRPGCHLCELLIEELMPLLRARGCVQVHDIDRDPELEKKYGQRIPVVEHRGRLLCEFKLDPAAIERALREAEPSAPD
ncbi:MAG: glutaredoxin family protein [Woeseia sp.]